jgi:hypothetical protein
VALSDIYAAVDPNEDPYHLAARFGFRCIDLQIVDLFDTARALRDSDHGELLLTFIGGWLKANGGSVEDLRAFVGLAADAAAIAVERMAPDANKAVTVIALEAAKAWARGEKTGAEVAAAVEPVQAQFDADEDAPYAMLGVWSAGMFAVDIDSESPPTGPRPFEGDEATYPEIAAFVRASLVPPENSPWSTY